MFGAAAPLGKRGAERPEVCYTAESGVRFTTRSDTRKTSGADLVSRAG